MASGKGTPSSKKRTFDYWLNRSMRIAILVLGFVCMIVSMTTKQSWQAGPGVALIVASLFYDRIVRLKWLGGEAEFSPVEIVKEFAEKETSVIKDVRDRVIEATTGLADWEVMVHRANEIADDGVSKIKEATKSATIDVQPATLTIKALAPVVEVASEISVVTSGTLSELSSLLPGNVAPGFRTDDWKKGFNFHWEQVDDSGVSRRDDER